MKEIMFVVVLLFCFVIICYNNKTFEKQINYEDRIAIVGNGPLTDEQKRHINKYGTVVRFNTVKEGQPNDKTNVLCVRQNGHSFWGITSNSCKGDIHKINNTNDTHLIVLYSSDFNALQKEILSNCSNMFKTIHYIHVHKDRYFYPFDTNKQNEKFKGDSFSSGFVIICYYNYFHKGKYDIFGMNWNMPYHYARTFEKDIIRHFCKNPCTINKTKTNSY